MIWSYRGRICARFTLFFLAPLVFNLFLVWPVHADLPYGIPIASSLSNYDPFESRLVEPDSCIPPSIGEQFTVNKTHLPPLSAYLSPYLNLSELYTDNINLAPAGFEKSDLVTILNPGISGCTVGSLLKANFKTSTEGVAYQKNPPSNAFYLQQDGNFTYKLLPGHFFISGNLHYGQTAINPLQPNTTNVAFYTPNNRTNYYTRTLSPYWKQSFGDLGVGTLRYTYGRVNYGDSYINNSISEGKSFDLTSPYQNLSWSWVFHWYSNRVFFSGISEQQYFDTVSTQLGYRFNRTFQLLATIGSEDNYLPDGQTERYGSKFWNAGFVWTKPFYVFRFLWGHRFFGTSFDANLLLRMRNAKFSLQYNETPVSESSLVLNPRQTSSSLTPLSVTSLPLNQAQYAKIYLAKRWQANYTYSFSRSHLTLSAYNERDKYLTVPTYIYRLVGGIATFGWVLSSRSSIAATFEREINYFNGELEFQQDNTTIGWKHILSPSSLMGLSISHQGSKSINSYYNYSADSIDIYFHTIF